jgi:peroxiredoxin
MIMNSLRALALALVLTTPLQQAHAEPAIDFSLRDLANERFDLSSVKGKVAVISFWATWCAPCKEEMVHLEELYKEHKDDGLEIILISADDARTASRVKPYIKGKGFTFKVLYDRQSDVIVKYNPTKTLPYTVVVGPDFEIAWTHSGYNPGDEKELAEKVEKLLAGVKK